MKLVFYITQYNSVKDATALYLKIINDALNTNTVFKMVTTIPETKEYDVVVTFNVKDFIKLKLKRPRAKVVNWFQGVLPEEAYLKNNNKKEYYIFSILEYITLKSSKFNFFVSKEMKKHYLNKYYYKKDNCFIMPCFNSVLEEENSFYSQKNYNDPTFVYIGSMSKWQCIDLTILVFNEIKKKIPEATLTILTGEKEEAFNKCKQYNVKANIKYVLLDDLKDELLKYKYGFIIREDIKVNNVATPTKLSTYMASGVIPIYSNVIKDFVFLKQTKYAIELNTLDANTISEKIIAFENRNLEIKELYHNYQDIFDTVYNIKVYENKIKKAFTEYA